MSELLHNVEAIFTKDNGFLGMHHMDFYNIPLYQRGYKWTTKQVEKLLDDIDRFTPQTGKFYCVQNITIVPQEGGYFNVVDGQQRLATMVLILSRLGKKELVKHKIRFPKNSIREKTNEFINEYITDSKFELFEEFSDWNDFAHRYPEFDHQDIYFLFQAYYAINKWFRNRNDQDEYRDKLMKHVKFITNYIEGEKEERIFGNLNSKRIFLDGADLVRAMLITRVTNEEAGSDNPLKDRIRINERRVRIGWQLDEINRWWSDESVQVYFNPWLNIPSGEEIAFNKEKYPINRLLILFAESENNSELSLDMIEDYDSTLELYKKINKLHKTLKDWYSDKEIYHYLGFLFAQVRSKKNFDFLKVWNYWKNKSIRRSDFKVYLLREIKNEIFGSEHICKVFGHNKNWYEGDTVTLVHILLILDIIDANKDYKDKLQSEAFFKKGNDIEHIFPQTPQEQESKSEFVEFLLKYDEKLKENKILKRFELEKDNVDYQSELDVFFKSYTNSISIHSIGNLVLLYDSLNRSIKNNPYTFKRRKVMQYFNDGHFIQPHTLKVFARYFQKSGTTGLDLEHWTEEDIKANEDAIKDTLYNFFSKVD